jgi:hypothetical protein
MKIFWIIYYAILGALSFSMIAFGIFSGTFPTGRTFGGIRHSSSRAMEWIDLIICGAVLIYSIRQIYLISKETRV